MIELHLLDAAGHLEAYRAEILRCAQETLQRVGALMPLEGVDVVIAENPSWTIPGVGLGGYAPTAHLVQIWLDPSASGFQQALDQELAPTLAHELHHALRWRDPGYGTTLLEALVTEGLAQAFELPFRDGQLPYSAIPREPEWLDGLMRLARREFHLESYNHNDWFYGNEARGIPNWTGYALGFRMVQQYLKRTGQTAAEARSVPAALVLETLEAQTLPAQPLEVQR